MEGFFCVCVGGGTWTWSGQKVWGSNPLWTLTCTFEVLLWCLLLCGHAQRHAQWTQCCNCEKRLVWLSVWLKLSTGPSFRPAGLSLLIIISPLLSKALFFFLSLPICLSFWDYFFLPSFLSDIVSKHQQLDVWSLLYLILTQMLLRLLYPW